MAKHCALSECTVAETGVCLLNNELESCPNRILDSLATSDDGADLAPPLEAPPDTPRFPSSQALGVLDGADLMAQRYCRVLGVLGAPNAGKTAAIVSLFLLLGKEKLNGFSFADSRTLMALNEISQGARRWNEGGPPEQVTNHTELADDRDAGYLHLRLKRSADGETFDFLIPDLPGEWSNTLIDNNRTDRLGLLRSAEVFWLMADGRALASPDTRLTTLRRLDLLMARVAAMAVGRIRVLLVLTHRDSGEPTARDIEILQGYAVARGVDLTIVPIASFRRKSGLSTAGFGLDDLMSQSIGAEPPTPPLWPDPVRSADHRAMLSFRAGEGDHV